MDKRKRLIDQILPANKYGCYFRLVKNEDAEFILSLRTNDKLSRYINVTSSNIEDQINWIEEYKRREQKGNDFYLLSISQDKKRKYGLNRIYDITDKDFEIGSWLYSPNIGQDKAVLGDLFTRSIAFEILNLEICKIEVRKTNKAVLRYTKSFNPTEVAEDDLSYFFELDYNKFKIKRDELLKLFKYDK